MGDRNLSVTGEGADILGNDYQPLPTNEKLREYWSNNLPKGEKVIFDILVESYPEAVPKEEISDRTGYKRSSRDTYIQRLALRKLIKNHSQGMVLASKKLF